MDAQPMGGGNTNGLLGQIESATANQFTTAGLPGYRGGAAGSQGTTFTNAFNPRYQGVDFQRGTQGVDFQRGAQGVDFQRGQQGVDFQRGQQGVDFTKPGMYGDVRRTDFQGIGNQYGLSRPDSFGAERASMEKAMYDRAMNLMRPELDRQENRMTTDLVNRGLPGTSEAYREMRGQFDDQRARDINDLSLASVQAGAQEHERLSNLAARNRGQLTAEGAQRYGEDMGIRQQGAAEAGQAAQEQLGLRGIESGESAAIMAAQNALRSTEAGEAAQIMNAQNQLRGTQAQEAGQIMNAQNQLRGTQAQEAGNIMSAQLGLRGEQSADARAMAHQQAILRSQQAQEAQAGFSQSMAQRQQALQERMLERTQPTNDLAGLLSAIGQASQPQPYTNYAIQSPDYMGLAGSNYGSQANAYAARQGGQQSGLGGILGGASSLIGGLFSDRRLKKNIRKVGELHNGLPVYAYWMFDHWEIGLMADEVQEARPEAVGELVGFLTVDYDKATR